MADLAEVEAELAAIAATFDADLLLGSEAAQVVSRAARIANLASTIEMAAAARVAATPMWKGGGARTPAEWLARATKSSVGDAIGFLETAEQLGACPAVDAKARAGELSPQQARALVGAVAVDPAAEGRLLKVAEIDGLRRLQEQCRTVRLAQGDADERYARIHRSRSLRHWTDDEGAFRLAAKLTPDAGAQVLGALAPFEKAAFEQARVEGRHEPHEAYAADGLAAMASASLSPATAAAPTGRRKPSVTVMIDLAALMRGRAEPGEMCEIPGVGPLPVSRLLELAPEAVWHALVTDGVDIRSYCSFTRHIPTLLRLALEARDRECVVPGCNQTVGLEIDHVVPVEHGGATSYGNTARVCHFDHHERKHRQGWVLGGEPGAWTFTPPGRASERRPP
jgi:hypothetical protein